MPILPLPSTTNCNVKTINQYVLKKTLCIRFLYWLILLKCFLLLFSFWLKDLIKFMKQCNCLNSETLLNLLRIRKSPVLSNTKRTCKRTERGGAVAQGVGRMPCWPRTNHSSVPKRPIWSPKTGTISRHIAGSTLSFTGCGPEKKKRNLLCASKLMYVHVFKLMYLHVSQDHFPPETI